MAHNYYSKDRTSDVLNEENVNIDFASLLLSSEVLTGLSRAGFERPSPIQLKAIPLGRCGLDLIVQAKSGTGKTCVFSVIILESLDLQCGSVQALILTPTREIATQVQGVIQSIGDAMHGLRCHTFIGGTLFGPDRQKLKKCHVAVGTPGRVKQLIEYDVMSTDSIRLFILDEVDKLLEEKFQDQINWIYNRLPVNKQMLAVSATYPEALARGLTSYMRDPMFVRLNPRKVALKGIKQFYKVIPGHGLYHKAFEIKVDHLLQLLTQVSFSQCLVFSNLSSRAQNLSDILCERGWPSTCISSRQDQTQRLSAMSMLKTFQCRVLISTDLTARGIDAENVNLIVNLDVPSNGKTYMHRIGRAGRFGSKGVAVTLASEGNEETLLRDIQRQCHVKLHHLPDPVPSDLVNAVDINHDCSDDEEGSFSSQLDCDDNSQDKTEDNCNIQFEAVELRAQSPLGIQTSLYDATQDVDELSSVNTTIGEVPHRIFRHASNHWSRVKEEGEPVSQGSHKAVTSVSDKACQVNTLSQPFNIGRPIDFTIPSLAEKFSPKRPEDQWTWQEAVKDFDKFMRGCSESVDSQLDGHVDARDATETLQTPGKLSCVVVNNAVKCELEDEPRITQVHHDVKTLSRGTHQPCNVPYEQPVHGTEEVVNGRDQFSALRSAPQDHSFSVSCFSKDEVSKSEKLPQSCLDETEEKSAADMPSSDSVVNCTPVMTAAEEAQEGGESGEGMKINDKNYGNNSDKLGEQQSYVESNKTYEVRFSWRPSQDFFSLLTESSSSECGGPSLKPATPDTSSNETEASSRDSVTGFRDNNTVHVQEKVKVNGLSKVAKDKTETGHHDAAVSSSEKQKLLLNSKGKSSLATLSNQSVHNGIERASPDWQVPATEPNSRNLLPKNALVSNRQLTKETSRPGDDPVWQFYTSYLTPHGDGLSNTDSCRESDDLLISDNVSSSNSQKRSGSLSDICTGDSGHAPKNSQGWSPDSLYQPMPNDSSSFMGYYVVPGFIPTSTMSLMYPPNYDYLSQPGFSDQFQTLYSGQYTYWPHAYY